MEFEFTEYPLLLYVLNNYYLLLCGEIAHLLSSLKEFIVIPSPLEWHCSCYIKILLIMKKMDIAFTCRFPNTDNYNGSLRKDYFSLRRNCQDAIQMNRMIFAFPAV